MLLNKNRANYFLLLALGATLIGFAPIFVKWSELSPSWILFYRMFLTLPFLALLNLYIYKTSEGNGEGISNYLYKVPSTVLSTPAQRIKLDALQLF